MKIEKELNPREILRNIFETIENYRENGEESIRDIDDHTKTLVKDCVNRFPLVKFSTFKFTDLLEKYDNLLYDVLFFGCQDIIEYTLQRSRLANKSLIFEALQEERIVLIGSICVDNNEVEIGDPSDTMSDEAVSYMSKHNASNIYDCYIALHGDKVRRAWIQSSIDESFERDYDIIGETYIKSNQLGFFSITYLNEVHQLYQHDKDHDTDFFSKFFLENVEVSTREQYKNILEDSTAFGGRRLSNDIESLMYKKMLGSQVFNGLYNANFAACVGSVSNYWRSGFVVRCPNGLYDIRAYKMKNINAIGKYEIIFSENTTAEIQPKKSVKTKQEMYKTEELKLRKNLLCRTEQLEIEYWLEVTRGTCIFVMRTQANDPEKFVLYDNEDIEEYQKCREFRINPAHDIDNVVDNEDIELYVTRLDTIDHRVEVRFLYKDNPDSIELITVNSPIKRINFDVMVRA